MRVRGQGLEKDSMHELCGTRGGKKAGSLGHPNIKVASLLPGSKFISSPLNVHASYILYLSR